MNTDTITEKMRQHQQRLAAYQQKMPEYIETTLQGMKLCLGRWYDTTAGIALARLYLHLYNERNPVNLIDLGIYCNETMPYLEAVFMLRGFGKEPHQLGGDSEALMEQIKKKYGKRMGKV